MKKLDTLLFATDFSTGAAHATEIANTLARLTGAKLHVVHVLTLLETSVYWQTPMIAAGVDQRRLDEELRTQAEHELGRFVERYFEDPALGDPLEIERKVVEARVPFEAIIAEAERIGADMIVMGTHGRSGVLRALAGSTAERVVRHSPVPVLTSRG